MTARPGSPSRLRRVPLVTTVVGVVAALLPVTTAPSPAAAAATVSITPDCAVGVDSQLETELRGRAPHPKVVVGPSDAAHADALDALARPVKSSTEGRRVRAQLRQADAALAAPLPTSATSLAARASQQRMLWLYFAMSVAADGRSEALSPTTSVRQADVYADRIVDEVMAFVRERDWASAAPLRAREDNLLYTAEVAGTVALGYSLAANRMTSSQRGATRRALLDKALAPACSGWQNGSFMVDSTTNWGVVVNAGMAMAAVVVADQDVSVAAAALTQALPRANRAIAVSAADGGTPEGPSYAGLLQTYAAYLGATMELALGQPGLDRVHRIPQAARYLDAIVGPSREAFNYGDSNAAWILPILPVWNARHGGDPLGDWLADQVVTANNPHPLIAFWHRGAGSSPAATESLATAFPATGVAVLRSGWSTGATYLGVKAGSNDGGHSHLDLGSFVLDSGGQRFAGDYGLDNYSVAGYFDVPERYSIFRVASAGHNVLQRVRRNQPAHAVAPMSPVRTTAAGDPNLTVKTSGALGIRAASRKFFLQGANAVVQDRVRSPRAVAMRWWMHTQAGVTLTRGGRGAVLTRGGRTVEVRLASSTRGRLRTAPAPAAPRGGRSNADWTRLFLDVVPARGADGVYDSTTTVVFVPR